MKVVYSVAAKLGGPGVGNTSFNAVSGIYRAGFLERLFISSNAQELVPRTLIREWGLAGRGFKYLGARDRTGLIDHWLNWIFDLWVAAQVPQGDLFHGWNALCLSSVRTAKRRGMVTVVERASAHPADFVALVREEYARWNIKLTLPMWNYARGLADLAEADYITVPSAFARDSMLAHGTPARKLIEIPFGVDLDRYTPPSGKAPNPFRVIFVGNISLAKGAQYLLEAWRKLQWRDAELWLVGRVTPEFPRARWVDLPNVRFIPHTDSLAGLYQQADLFVFPSIQEGSALVTYEAMASGLPVITTPNAGSVVRDGVDGFIVPIRDVDALTERMEKLRADGKTREQMGRSARSHVEQYSWQRYRERLVEAYRNIVPARAQ